MMWSKRILWIALCICSASTWSIGQPGWIKQYLTPDSSSQSSIGNTSASGGNPSVTGPEFTETVYGINMKFVRVEGGEFMMGGTADQGDDVNIPVRRVTLSSYYIGVFEVTQQQWEAVMGTSVGQQQNRRQEKYQGKWSLAGVGPDYPMYYVSWEEAQAFCQELSRKTGKRYCLPTEAQWEYAARGGKYNQRTKYSGSNSIDVVAWYYENSGLTKDFVRSTHPVGTKSPNALGIYDMSGNVYEWCQDWYGGYRSDDTYNPTGPSSGEGHVLRGGHCSETAYHCKVSYRTSDGPGANPQYDSNCGFRVVLLP